MRKSIFTGLLWAAVLAIPLAALHVFGVDTSSVGGVSSVSAGAGLIVVGAVDLFSTRTLLSALEYMKKPTTFLLDLFFTVEEPVDSDTIDIDIVRNGEKMATFVSPIVEGKVVKNEGFTTHSIKAPYLKEKMLLTPKDLMVREPGTTIYGPRDGLEQRKQRNLAKKLRIMLDRFTRREEWMASKGLTTGKVTVVGEGVPSREIDFDMKATHLPVNLDTSRWSDTTNSDPIEDLKTWAQLIFEDSDRVPDKCVMGKTALNLFLNHPKVKEVLDNRRMVMGDVKPGLQENGAQKIADWFDPNLEIWTYSGKYIDPSDGVTKNALMPDKGALLGSSAARCERHYAKIQDLEAGDAVVRYFPKSWPVKDPSGQWIMVQSAPLPAPHEIDAFVYATVD